MFTNLQEVVSEETSRALEQREMERAERAAIVALVESVPVEARKAMVRRAGHKVFESHAPMCFWLYPAKPHQSPFSYCYWVWDTDGILSDIDPAYGFTKDGTLVRVLPIESCDEWGDWGLGFAKSEIDAEGFANAINVSDGYAEVLAKKLQDGLDKTLEALRKRRERIAEVKATAERIAASLQP